MVDSSKTLVQGPNGGPQSPQGNSGSVDGAGLQVERRAGRESGDGSRIRICDERSQRPGELLLGRYRLFERLGAGGFGTVWHAHDELLDRDVAVKRILLPSEEDRERAMREALATARLAHPAIVALYEATAEENAFYLISELVQGDTLARLIAEDELADEDVLEIGLALCEALEHAHARGVIHRDVKPQNVLIPSDTGLRTPARGASAAVAKLADFGGARLAGDDALTRTGDVFGTLAYMAPEQSEGHDVDTGADLYSLALVLYEAFSGVNPVRGRTPAATARRIGAPIEPLGRRRGDLPRELTRALDVALNPDPSCRGTLADLHNEFEDVFERGLRRRLFARRISPRRPPDLVPEWSSEGEPRSSPGQTDGDARGVDLSPSVRERDGVSEADANLDEWTQEAPATSRVALPRLVWLGCLFAVAVWQAAAGRPGVSVMVLAAGAPLLALPRRCGLGWLAAVFAPVLGLAGLAGAFPALAGQRASWQARGGLAALGFWWLSLAEPLLARHLWLGPPRGIPTRVIWESSPGKAATHVVAATLTVEVLLGAAVWAFASVVLPWIVRGRSALLDAVAAIVWTVGLLAAVPLLERTLLGHSGELSPRGALLGAVLGCALAVCARALRGPV